MGLGPPIVFVCMCVCVGLVSLEYISSKLVLRACFLCGTQPIERFPMNIACLCISFCT